MASVAKPWSSCQPWKAIYITFYLATLLFLVPFWIAYYIPRPLRPHKKWTYHQALMNRILKVIIHFAAAIELKTARNLEPGAEKDRFVVIEPMEDSFYQGVANDPDIRPVAIGAVWYPDPYKLEDMSNKTFILYFHGGAFVTGYGRDMDCAFAANLLASKTSSKIFVIQYRLSSNPGGRFPAALQDSITAYHYLLNHGIPASRIAISGDSAGANLIIALLRYISEVKGLRTTPPAAALLWSPWLDLETSADPECINHNENSKTDYITQNYINWGVRTFVPMFMNISDPYISPFNHPFACKTAIWIQAGGVETLYDSIVKFSQTMEATEGNVVDLYIEPYANHDIILIGNLTGFKKEVTRCAEKAMEFLTHQGFNVSR